MITALFVSHSSELRGAENSLELFVRRVDRLKIQPVIAMPGKGPLFDLVSRLAVPVYDVPMQWWVPPRDDPPTRLACQYSSLVERLNFLREIITRHDCRIVHSNSLVVADGALAAFLEKRPHVWHVRENLNGASGLDPLLGKGMTLAAVKGLSEKVVAVSEATASQFRGRQKLRVIYNGVELKKGTPIALPGKAGALKIAFVGNLVERKGPDLFVDACRRLTDVNAEFYLVGELSDKRVTDRVMGLLEGDPRRDRFHFLGLRRDVPQILSACDIYVLSSRNDPFPRTVLESMASGCAVVTTSSGGAAEAVRSCSAGEVVPATVEGILDGLRRLIREPNYMRQCRESARRNVFERYSAERYVQNLAGLLQEVAGNWSKGKNALCRRRFFNAVQRSEYQLLMRAFSAIREENSRLKLNRESALNRIVLRAKGWLR